MRLARSRNPNPRSFLVVIVAVLFLWQQSAALLLSQTATPPPKNLSELKITVLSGEDGVNIIKKKTAVKPVVEVRDKNNLPVAGAYVAFASPDSGAHVIFEHGSSTYSTVTDSSGRATVHMMKPVGAGHFKINVNASFQGQTVTTSIAQTNYLTMAAGGISGTMIGLIVAGVAAGVVGVVVGTQHKSSPPTQQPPPSSAGTISTSGPPVFTPPK